MNNFAPILAMVLVLTMAGCTGETPAGQATPPGPSTAADDAQTDLAAAAPHGCELCVCPDCPACTCSDTSADVAAVPPDAIADKLLSDAPLPGRAPVRLGVDRLLTDEVDILAGKRVGLITNASGVDGELVPSSDRLAADPRVDLVRLYAPEHGLRGVARAGSKVDDALDPVTGLPVHSLFGKRRAPTPESLADIDVLLFDIQDVGSRTYTYISTLGLSMKAARKAGVAFVVLDRPNPQGGLVFEGPVRDRAHKSFVGWGPLPVSHGMTTGELAMFYNAELEIGCDLHVVKMGGWSRDMTWEDTGLTWVPTSPNIPHARNAHLYIATGMIAGVAENVNESAGYTMPFETIAAEFMDAHGFAERMSALQLDGVVFRPISYEPRAGRFRKKTLHGVQLIPTDYTAFRPLHVALSMLATIESMYPGQFQPRGNFARIWGTDTVLPMIRDGASVADIEASWARGLEQFSQTREKYLLY